MIKYLVIGSLGTLGSEFMRLLPANQTIGVDKQQLDVTDLNAVKTFFEEHKPKIVINCAAYTNVDGAESDYDSALLLNKTIPQILSEVCNQFNSKLVHFSTGMVFAGNNSTGYDENDQTVPVNKYGESKLEGEKVIQEVCHNFLIIRTEWLYGKPSSETAKKSFIELMIELGKSGHVKAVNDETGKPTWSKDLAKATIELISSERKNEVFHLVNEGSASRLDWVKEIYAILEMQVEVEAVSGLTFPRPAKRPEFEILNNTKLPKLRSWQEALKEYLLQ